MPSITALRTCVLDYYRRNRRALPWRTTRDPYKILVSEVMLQQTQVPRVIEKYTEFIRRFPTVESLTRAPLADVLRAWQGLGYNRRAYLLRQLAARVAGDFGGTVPSDPATLEKLPGVGKATAKATCAFAFNKPVVFIETNIRSVFIHHFFPGRRGVTDAELTPFVERALDAKNPRRWYSALMDYGVHLKQIYKNPSRRSAHHQKQGRFQGSDRQIRGLILKCLLQGPRLTERALINRAGTPGRRTKAVIARLIEEELLRRQGRYIVLPKN